MAVTGKTRIKVDMTTTTAIDQGTVISDEAVTHNIDWTDGSGANQAEKVFSDERTLSGSSSEDLDLAGSLTDSQGNTITFTAIKSLTVIGGSSNGDDIEVGGAAANGWYGCFKDSTDIGLAAPGGAFHADNPSAAGWAVTPGTGDLLKIANADGSTATYEIEIVGITS